MADTLCQPFSAGAEAVARRPLPWASVLTTLLLIGAAAGIGRAVLGPTLGLLFFVLITATVGRLTGAGGTSRWLDVAIDFAAAVVVCLAAVGIGGGGQTVQLLGVVFVCTMAVSSLARLTAVAVGTSFAQTLTLLLFLKWLTLPVWLSPYWSSGPMLDRLLDAHPIFAINGLYAELGDWTHAPLAYNRLTNLNQDIPFALPASIGWSVGVHLTVAIVCIALRLLVIRVRPFASRQI